MSIEFPEARILAQQMNRELPGKLVKSYDLKDFKKLQRLGSNKNTSAFNKLVEGKIETVASRGNVIRVKFDNGTNLILAPEYGGRVTFHADAKTIPEKLHLRLDFSDGSVLVVRLLGMGIIQAVRDDELDKSYVYRRDFSTVPSPSDTDGFAFRRFLSMLEGRKDMPKALLVGKEAIVAGLGNSTYQDIIYKARIHPKRKASDQGIEEKRRLYEAIRHVVSERLRLGGKDKFCDLYGKQGHCPQAIGSHVKTCPTCGANIEKLSIGGGQTYFWPINHE